jgi:hypothetical protein
MPDSIIISGSQLALLREKCADNQRGYCLFCEAHLASAGQHDTNCPLYVAPPPIDATNKFSVGYRGDNIVYALRCLPSMHRISKPEAINLAAYLVALADSDGQFERLLEAARGGK